MSKLTDHYRTIRLPFLNQPNPGTGTVKLDTKATIALFLRSIPKEIIEREKRAFPYSFTCLDENLRPEKLIGATTLKDSDTRKLMVLTRLYFTCKSVKECELNPQKEEEILTNNLKELSEFMDHIDGVDLMAQSKNADILSADFVFSSESWFPKEAKQLSGPIAGVLQFLKEKKYTLTTKPQEGAIAVYCRAENKTATHYGIVQSVEKNGDVKILSKFGTNPVYLHLAEAVHYIHGNQIFYLIPPRQV
jgi:hypothetical protein